MTTATESPTIARPPSPTLELTEEQWAGFHRDGFLHLGQVLSEDEVERLKQRADELAAGRVRNEHVLLQQDTGGAYEDLPEAVEQLGGSTRLYRKIQGLEYDDEFVHLVRHPRFFEVCARIYGPHVPLSVFRAMVMNKPAGQGTVLPWHQDGGDVWGLDREPLVTIWTALDPATTENGCMECVRGSHSLGLLTDFGSTLSEEHVAEHCAPESVVPLEVPAGHAVLMHNWLIHRSGVNPSAMSRRAVTICYLDGRTRTVHTGTHLPVVAGAVNPAPPPYVRELAAHAENLSQSASDREVYALSLKAELEKVRAELDAAHVEVERLRKRGARMQRRARQAELAAARRPSFVNRGRRMSRRVRRRVRARLARGR
jgi:ectoine hydroxylase-related dioxygenase (phytanoyl-CoA dioxygenase family)